jgi:hypothetical protein
MLALQLESKLESDWFPLATRASATCTVVEFGNVTRVTAGDARQGAAELFKRPAASW